MGGRLVWIDLEMTGLNPETSVILEIASVVTDGSLRTVAEGPDIAIHWPEKALQNMESWSKTQHESSGLLERVRASSVDCWKAEEEVLGFPFQALQKGEVPSVRQFHLAGPPVPDQVHAQAGSILPLPQHRREFHQGTGEAVVSGTSRVQERESPSCLERHQRIDQRAEVLPRKGF